MIFDNQNKKTGLARINAAFVNSCRGFHWMSKNETAFKQEILLLPLLTGVSFLLDISLLEQVLLIVSLLIVILAETVNTAIEAIVDRIGLEIHPLSGLAKDLGSAAVLISCTIAVLIWGAVLCS